MSLQILDLETLALQCLTSMGRTHMNEAIAGYHRGLYRSAIVLTWVAIVFDLIEKIREISLAGEPKAQKMEQDFNNFLTQIDQGNSKGIANSLEFERNILEIFKTEFNYFDAVEYAELLRIREDRNKCAHPSFHRQREPYNPTPEIAKHHIRNAISFVLSRPPIFGKAALENFLVTVSSNYFPLEVEMAMPIIQNLGMHSPTPGFIRAALDGLLFGFIDPQSRLKNHSGVSTAMNCIIRLHHSEASGHICARLPKIFLQVTDPDLPLLIKMLAQVNDFLSFLDQSAKAKINEFVRVGPITEVSMVFSALSMEPDIAATFSGRISNLDENDLTVVTASKIAIKPVRAKVLEILSSSKNWARTNEIMTKMVIPIFQDLSKEDIIEILRMPVTKKADFIGAIGFGLFVLEVSKTNSLPPEELNKILSEIKADYLIEQLNEI